MKLIDFDKRILPTEKIDTNMEFYISLFCIVINYYV